MQDIRIELFDPRTATAVQWTAYHAYRRQRHEDDRRDGILDEVWWPDDTAEVAIKIEFPLYREEIWTAWRAGQIISVLTIGQRREGTDDTAAHAPHCSGWISVLKSHQRQGLGESLGGAVSRARAPGTNPKQYGSAPLNPRPPIENQQAGFVKVGMGRANG